MGKSYAAWREELEWVPMHYDGIETAFVKEDSGDSYYLARWGRVEDHGLLAWATVHGPTREDAMRILIESAPDIMLALHQDLDREVQKRRMAEPGEIEAYTYNCQDWGDRDKVPSTIEITVGHYHTGMVPVYVRIRPRALATKDESS